MEHSQTERVDTKSVGDVAKLHSDAERAIERARRLIAARLVEELRRANWGQHRKAG